VAENLNPQVEFAEKRTGKIGKRRKQMKIKLILTALATALALMASIGSATKAVKQGPAPVAQNTDGPRYTSDGLLLRPANYRDWVFLSSSVGLQYGPGANPANPSFENVYVNPSAYNEFAKTGKWPDKTMFVLEIRRSMEKGTFARGGHYQGEVVTMEAAVKDEARFPEKWAYFGLGKSAESARAFPKGQGCFSCHNTNGAVENSFAQFYPTVFAIAKEKGTLNPGYLEGQAAREAAEAHSGQEQKAPAESGAAAPKPTPSPEGEEVEDLVCNMPVKKATALKTIYQNKTYYFCRQQCKDDFERAPLQFIKALEKE
jgi:YHS domain-containing protein